MKKLLIVLLLMNVIPALACSCIRSEFSKKDVDNASYILKGEVLEVHLDKERRQKVIKFRVDRKFKGETDNIVEVRTASNGAACGLYVLKDDKWLLFVYENEGKMSVGLCAKNIRYSRRPKESYATSKKNCKTMKSYLKKIKEFKDE
jgi:hypothetical protein